ncbi:hypothetical protein ACIQUB_26625 [Rhizobium sp. NPDC090275]
MFQRCQAALAVAAKATGASYLVIIAKTAFDEASRLDIIRMIV